MTWTEALLISRRVLRHGRYLWKHLPLGLMGVVGLTNAQEGEHTKSSESRRTGFDTVEAPELPIPSKCSSLRNTCERCGGEEGAERRKTVRGSPRHSPNGARGTWSLQPSSQWTAKRLHSLNTFRLMLLTLDVMLQVGAVLPSHPEVSPLLLPTRHH